jgi:DNA-binding GntR family transcriptional regulator
MDEQLRVTRRALGDQIADSVREQILLGRLAAGTPMSQQSVCEQYGTSRMPARDALIRLAAEGLIITRPGGQSEVARLTQADIQDVFDVEALVHGRAARRACDHANADDIAALTALHKQMLAAARAKDLDRLGDLNYQFHRRINLLSDSPKLLAVLRSISFAIPRSYLVELPGWAKNTTAEHAQIVAAFTARDGAAVEQTVHDHVRDAGANLVAYLHKKGMFRPVEPAVSRRGTA